MSTGEGETLTLSLPSPRAIVLLVDPVTTGSPFTVVTEHLPSHARIPLHRHLWRDLTLVVSRGQGRLLVEGAPRILVPGVVCFIPRQKWVEVHNTGTGVLQFAWVSAPPGLETFFRDCSRLDPAAAPALIQEVAARHGVEIASAPSWSPPRQVGVGRNPERPRSSIGGLEGPAAPTPPPASGSRRRHHRRHRGGPRPSREAPSPAAGSPPPSPTAQPVKPVTPPAVAGPPPEGSRPPRRGRGDRGGRSLVKEVYMGGRWVQVSGEGPVIA